MVSQLIVRQIIKAVSGYIQATRRGLASLFRYVVLLGYRANPWSRRPWTHAVKESSGRLHMKILRQVFCKSSCYPFTSCIDLAP